MGFHVGDTIRVGIVGVPVAVGSVGVGRDGEGGLVGGAVRGRNPGMIGVCSSVDRSGEKKLVWKQKKEGMKERKKEERGKNDNGAEEKK